MKRHDPYFIENIVFLVYVNVFSFKIDGMKKLELRCTSIMAYGRSWQRTMTLNVFNGLRKWRLVDVSTQYTETTWIRCITSLFRAMAA